MCNAVFQSVQMAFKRYALPLSSLVGGIIIGPTIFAKGSSGVKHDEKASALALAPCTMPSPWQAQWDVTSLRNDVNPNKSLTTAKRYIYLVRHGKYKIEEKEADEKQLTELGFKQATATGKYFAKLGIKFDSIISSGMIRAVQTARSIVNELKDNPTDVPQDPRLNEGAVFHLTPRIPEYGMDMEDHLRIEEAFQNYFKRPTNQGSDTHEMIVCHGNVIRYFILRALQLPPEGWIRLGIDHGSVSRLVIDSDGRVTLECFSESFYMDTSLITQS